jgi:hypothetical protein
MPATAEQILYIAFELATRASGPVGHGRAQEELTRRCPDVEPEQLAQLYARATDLAGAAAGAAESCRGGATESTVLADLARRHPGVSPATLHAALAWGYFVTR